MRCPYCNSLDSQVKDSRPDENDGTIRRRRFCEKCGAKFSTVEHVQLRELKIRKHDGRIEPFNRNKIKYSIQIACRKRNITDEQIDTIITSLYRRLETKITDDIVPSEAIGDIVLESLLVLDPIAFIRFASVYRKFSKISEFKKIIDELPDDEHAKKSDAPTKLKSGTLF